MFNHVGIKGAYKIKQTTKNVLGNQKDKTESFESLEQMKWIVKTVMKNIVVKVKIYWKLLQ